jgi:tRNA nucleotidyltransferase (CCA-adding enzyme)
MKYLTVKDPIINLSILFHDLGKLNTHSVDEKGMHRYLGHASEAKDLIEEISKRLKMDNETKDALLFSALNHMKFHDILNMSNSKIAQLMSDKNWEVLKAVAEADAKSRLHMFDQKQWNQIIDKIDDLTERFKDRNAIMKIKKIVNGDLVMQLTGLKTGPEVGKIINKTVQWILDDRIDVNDKEKIKTFIINQKG